MSSPTAKDGSLRVMLTRPSKTQGVARATITA
jgi:hypothetical protein